VCLGRSDSIGKNEEKASDQIEDSPRAHNKRENVLDATTQCAAGVLDLFSELTANQLACTATAAGSKLCDKS